MTRIFLAALLCAACLPAQEGRGDRRDRERGDRRDQGERGERGGAPMRFMNPVVVALDTDGDGTISAAEMANAAASLKKLDKNGDGQLTPDELRPNFEGRGLGREGGGPGRPNPEEMVSRLMEFDRDGDGKLSKSEVPERMQGMFERGDADKDGFLTRDELRKLAESQGGPGSQRERK